MNAPVATVIAVDARVARVRVDAQVACARCADGRGCGAGLLGKRQPAREFEVEIPRGMTLRIGDQVQLSLQPRRLLQASVYAYGLPLASLVLMPALAEWAWGPFGDLQLAGLGLAALVVAVMAGRRLLARPYCLGEFTPGIERRVGGRA